MTQPTSAPDAPTQPDPEWSADPAELTAGDPPPDDDAGIPLALLRRYSELRGLEKISKAEAEAYKQEADVIQSQLVDHFAEAGMQNINIDGKTLYLHRDVFAAREDGIEETDVHAALRAAGAESLIAEKVNHQSLSAYIRELTDDDGPGLPEPLVGVLRAAERFSVRIRAAAKKKG